MGVYSRVVFPFALNLVARSPLLAEQRRSLLARARGEVVEIGFGTGANLPYYPASVTALTAVEPNPGMRRYWERAGSASGIRLEIVEGCAERLPFGDALFDTAVTTLTLCSVRDPGAALGELRRVLKPGGQLLFLEHGVAPDPGVARWQRRLEPLNRAVSDGCHLTRDMAALVAGAGFVLESLEKSYLPKAPRTHGFVYRGLGRRN